MNSRLSSLLVRDGVLGVKRMEQAFQRQVIYGGALDTIVLEMGAVPEERLWHYLSLATALPSADRDLLEYFDPRAVQICPRDTAERFHVAPCAMDGQALRVLVTDPADLAELEGLATTLGLPVQPFVVPEYRFHLQLERLFGIAPPSRYAALSRKCGFVPSARPAEPRVVVDDAPNPGPRDTLPMAAVPEPVPARTTQVISTGALQRQVAEEDARRLAAEGAHGTILPAHRTAGPEELTPTSSPAVRPAPAIDGLAPLAMQARGTIPMSAVTPPDPADIPDKVITDESLLHPPPQNGGRAAADAGAARPWRGGGGGALDPSAVEPREASLMLARTEDRDAVFALLVRAARSRARYAALLTVQGVTAFGRMAIEGYALDPDIGQVAIPLASAPALRDAYGSHSPYIGPVATGIPEIDAMLEQMGGVIPSTALVLPVVIRERTVALLYAHRGADNLSISEVADVLPVASDAAMALSRLIVKAKSTGFARAEAAATRAPATAIGADELPAKKVDKGDGWARPAAAPGTAGGAVTSDFGATVQMPAQAPPAAEARQPRNIAWVLDALEAGHEPAASQAAEEALVRVDDVMPELARRFPGQLAVDRYGTGGRSLRASQYGPLLALTIRIGARVVPLLVEKLASADREVRFYATLALAEVRAPIAVGGLVARVFDSDYGVLGAALDALAGYPPRDVDAALEPVRRALRSDSLRARAAAHALGELRDVKALLDLIDATERDATTAAEARRALVLITRQDFGTKAKKWRKWWEEHKGRSRIEWLLEALGHSETSLREAAVEELRRMTGEHFGYHADGPKREREEARQRWLKWWDETGRQRFTRDQSGGVDPGATGRLPGRS
jgi:hypothetical protein